MDVAKIVDSIKADKRKQVAVGIGALLAIILVSHAGGLDGTAEDCFSSGGHLPALEDAVKNNLDNPAAYQFVDLVVGSRREGAATVFLGFRGENGFGAIRRGTVRATLHTADCSVTDIGEPEVD